MPYIVRLKINKVYMYPHSNGNKPVDDLLAEGMKLHADRWRSIYGIDYRFVIGKTSGIPVTAYPVIIKGQHYRGVAKGSSSIGLHNGYVPAENRRSNTMWSKDQKGFIDQVGIILHHEICHILRFRFGGSSHSSTRNDLMHPWCGRDLINTLTPMRNKFGTLKTSLRKESMTLETAPVFESSQCYRGHCFSVTP